MADTDTTTDTSVTTETKTETSRERERQIYTRIMLGLTFCTGLAYGFALGTEAARVDLARNDA